MAKFLISPSFIFGLFIVIFFGHALGLDLRWYNLVDSLDTIHHALGGVWISAVVFYFLDRRSVIFDISKNRVATVIFGVGVVALAGIAWEVFEFFIDRYLIVPGVSPFPKMELADTIFDLVADILGGLAHAMLFLGSAVRGRA